ncbi:MAG: abortive infection family protein [Saprospiraceae bacterium]|nr:abortive infection family protein [Saprospiraceae bacterium]
MEKLRKVFDQHGKWKDYLIYVERIEAHSQSDFSVSLENSKALLESIGKEICSQNGTILSPSSNLNGLLKQAFRSMGYSKQDMVNQISSSLATIGQQIGNLRNQIGMTSHGMLGEEIRERNNKVDELVREFLFDSVEIVCIYLIRQFESRKDKKAFIKEQELHSYEDNQAFNDFWDESYGYFEMGDYSFPASEILFHLDTNAYKEENVAYSETEE